MNPLVVVTNESAGGTADEAVAAALSVLRARTDVRREVCAEPGDLEMAFFSEAGYGDLAEPAGPTTTMDDPQKRIDYIWGIGVVGANPHTVMALGASDHRAVVVNVTRSIR